jgi:hypothetical protein
MKPVIFALFIALAALAAAPAYAQGPVGTPDTGYDFTPREIGSGDNPVAGELAAKMTDVTFINELGGNFATMMVILDNFGGGGVLGYFTIFMLGLWALHWVATFVFKRRLSRYEPDLVEVKDDTAGGDIGKAWSKVGNNLNRKKMRF